MGGARMHFAGRPFPHPGDVSLTLIALAGRMSLRPFSDDLYSILDSCRDGDALRAAS